MTSVVLICPECKSQKTPDISRKELLSFKFLSNFEEKELEK